MHQATEKDQLGSPFECQLPEARKYTNSIIAPVAEAVGVPAHLALSGSPLLKQLCHLQDQSSIRQSFQQLLKQQQQQQQQ